MALNLLPALDRFLEAIHKIRKQTVLQPLEKSLERSMAKAFKAQGKDFLRRFRCLGSTFPKIREAAAGFGWERLFKQAMLKTMKLFAVPITAAAGKALVAGAKRLIADIVVPVSFSLKNPRAVSFLKTYGADRVTKINDTTKDVIRGIVSQGTEEGWSYDRMAKEISDRFSEFAVGKPQQHIDSRAHLVAVTETANAYEEGNRQVAQQLKDIGLEMEKFWLTVGDDRVSDGCRENQNAGWLELDESFPSDHQRPPRFPGCRCDMLYRRKQVDAAKTE